MKCGVVLLLVKGVSRSYRRNNLPAGVEAQAEKHTWAIRRKTCGTSSE